MWIRYNIARSATYTIAILAALCSFPTAAHAIAAQGWDGHTLQSNNWNVQFDKKDGVPKDYAEGMKWWAKAAEEGDARAQNNLGVLLVYCLINNPCSYRHEYSESEKKEARAKWHAEFLDSMSGPNKSEIEEKYLNNLSPEEREAVKSWLDRFKTEGPAARIPSEWREAVKWWHKSAEHGNAYAEYNLAVAYLHPLSDGSGEGFNWLRKSAEHGYATAQDELGETYCNGGWHFPANCTEGIKWWRKAAEQGDAQAQRNLGKVYELGITVESDVHMAVEWYRKAAEQGNAESQERLALVYATGEGNVAKNAAESIKWRQKADESQKRIAAETEAKNNEVYAERRNQTKSIENRCQIGCAPAAKYILGTALYNEQEYVKAYLWFKLALKEGVDDAHSTIIKGELENLTKLMTSEQLAEAQHLVDIWKPQQVNKAP